MSFVGYTTGRRPGINTGGVGQNCFLLVKLLLVHSIRILIAIEVLCILTQPALAEVYRWQDARGQTHYSSAPPSTPVKHLEVKRDNYWIPYSGDSDAVPQSPSASTTVVPYRKDLAVMTIPVMLNQRLERIFAVDTGASYTILSSAVAEALNLQPNPELAPLTLQTANGEIRAPFVNIKALTIGTLTTYNVVAAIYDLHNTTEISGLLGLNVLNRFTMTVDAAQQHITFTPATSASTFRERNCVVAREWMQHGIRVNDGSDEEASFYQHALAACPNLLEAYYRLGHVYYRQKSYSDAIDIHQRLVQVAPEEAEAYYRLGVVYMLDRQFEFAKEAFLHTLRLAPSHPHAQNYLEQLRNGK